MSTALKHIDEQLKWSGGVDGLRHMANIVITRAEAEWIVEQLTPPLDRCEHQELVRQCMRCGT